MNDKLKTDHKDYVRVWNQLRASHDHQGAAALFLIDKYLANAWQQIDEMRQELNQTEQYKKRMKILLDLEGKMTRPADYRAPSQSDG